jgi:Na+/H+-dicarboxylate symporter
MKNRILLKVLLAMLLAVIAGWLAGPKATLLGVPYLSLFNLIGQLFLNALSLVVVPLVAASIITGSAKMGGEHSFGSMGLKTLGYFVLTSLLAILVGLMVGLIMTPGISAEPLKGMVSSSETLNLAEIKQQLEGGIFQKIEQILVKIIPSNIFAAASQGQMLGIIVFCLLFGLFTAKIERRYGETLIHFWQGVFQVMMQITHLVLRALPIGVFGLVAKAIATSGVDTLGSVAYFFLTVLIGLALYSLAILPILLKTVAGANPWRHIQAMFPALVTGFSTSSSAATLPITLECVEKRASVSNRVSSFAIPLGTSINLSGSYLYVCVSVLFIAQAYGIPLAWPALALIVLMTLLTSFGSAGIPSASLISIVVILQTLGLPADAIGLIMTVERLLDMFRTPVNIFGTSCCAVLVAHSEGEIGK